MKDPNCRSASTAVSLTALRCPTPAFVPTAGAEVARFERARPTGGRPLESYRLGVVSALFLAQLALSACASLGRARDPWSSDAVKQVATVAVRNNGDQDLTIYAMTASGARWRLGTVMRSGVENMVIPKSALNSWDVELTVVPVGGGPARALFCPKINPGARLRLVLERDPVLWSCAGT
jgi:hypothetical protein